MNSSTNPAATPAVPAKTNAAAPTNVSATQYQPGKGVKPRFGKKQGNQAPAPAAAPAPAVKP